MPTSPLPDLNDLLATMVEREASDLHLVTGYKPMLRVHGDLSAVVEYVLTDADVRRLLWPFLPEKNRAADAAAQGLPRDLDFATQIQHRGRVERFRANVFQSRGQTGACFRHIVATVPSIDALGIPRELAERIDKLNHGLVLCTGITGAGKTTTLAALVQRFNVAGGYRIITIEEPIEYVFEPAPGSVVTQREVGPDVGSFYDGLRYGLRQDPDILLVGEIRDRETAQLALSAAETGHLIFATLHTADAKGAITRLVDLFPPEMHDDVRTQLSMSLRCVIAQHLLQPPQRGARRVLAMEVLMTNFAVRSSIRTGKIETLESNMQSGRKDGMWTLDTHLKQLVQEGRIDMATARQFAKDPREFGGA